jgi:transposase
MSDAMLIPDDLATCQEQLRAAWALQAQWGETWATLQLEHETLKAQLESLQQENEEQQFTIQSLLHRLFGRRSERLDSPGQLHFSFVVGEPLAAETVSALAALDQADAEFVEQVIAKRRRNRQRPRSEELPAHLERRTQRIEPTLPTDCPFELTDCQLIGVDVVENLEFDPPQLWVLRLEYPKYKLPAGIEVATEVSATEALAANAELPEATRAASSPLADSLETAPAQIVLMPEPAAESLLVESASVEPVAIAVVATDSIAEGTLVYLPPIMLPGHGILQAPRLPNVIEGGRFGFGLVTEVLCNKFALHLPLYRQQDMFAQLGWSPHRSTLCQIVTHAADLLKPLAELLKARVLASDVLGTDDTTVTLLTPGQGDGSRTARFWLYRGRDGTPYNVFDFTDSREREGPDTFLLSFQGTFTGDCYGGYLNIEKLTEGRIRFCGCWGHARRKVFDARQQYPELAKQVLAIIGQLYELEDRARVLSDEARRELRQRESTVWLARLRELLDSESATKVLPKSKFGQALAYMRNHWTALSVYLTDGRLPIDNNDTERDLRRVAVGRKNWSAPDVSRRTSGRVPPRDALLAMFA